VATICASNWTFIRRLSLLMHHWCTYARSIIASKFVVVENKRWDTCSYVAYTHKQENFKAD
jgi:hypothetical protein